MVMMGDTMTKHIFFDLVIDSIVIIMFSYHFNTSNIFLLVIFNNFQKFQSFKRRIEMQYKNGRFEI